MLNQLISLTHKYRNKKVSLGSQISKRVVWVTLLIGVLVGGCNPVIGSQSSTPVMAIPTGTPLATPKQLIFETKISQMVPTNAPSSITPMDTLIPTSTPIPVQTKQSFGENSQLIAFTSLHNGYPTVYTINTDNGSLNRLTPDSMSGFLPKWSPDGEMIGFLSTTEANNSQLVVVDVLNKELFKADVNNINSFSWSPDGQFIVFTSNKLTPDNHYRTYTMSVADLQPKVLYESDVVALDVQWSPTNDQILSLALTSVQLQFAYILDLTGGAKELPLKGSPGYADWNPNGQQIAYDNIYFPAFGQKEIRMINVNGVDDKPITEADYFSHDPQWSPNGDMIAYQSYAEDTNPIIYLKNINTGAKVQVSSSDMRSWYPSWSSNGKYIAFLVETEHLETKGYSLHVFSVDTGEVTKFVDEFVAAYRPDWHP